MELPATRSAIDWVRDSLERGGPFSKCLLGTWRPGTVATVFVDEDSFANKTMLEFDDHSRGLSVRTTRRFAVSELEGLARSDRYLIIEDDLGRTGDPHVGADVLQIDDRIARVFRLTSSEDIGEAVEGLLRGASGYPTNAFVVEVSLTQIEYVWSSPSRLTATQLDVMLSHVIAVIVSAFDAETFLLVRRGEGHPL